MMDAITLLKDDHKTVEKLFKQFEKAGDKAYAEKRKVAGRICEELSIHAAIEEQLFYPVIRATVDGVEDDTLESLEEHHIVKWVLSEIDDMDPKDERFTAKMTVLIENVRHHVEEEEGELFPKVRDGLGRNDLGELGDAMQAAKKIVPTHPHPRSPDTPPANIAVGAVAGLADKATDAVRGAAQGAVSTAQDVIDAIRGRNGTTSSSNGSRSSSRRPSTGSRSSASRTTTPAKKAARKATAPAKKAAKRTASQARATGRQASSATRSTARTASNEARKTASTASKGATRTARTAKRGASRTSAAARS